MATSRARLKRRGMRAWKTIDRKQILDFGKYLKVESHTIRLPDGRVIRDWAWVITPDYINVMAVTEDGRFLCFRQTKYAVQGDALAPVGGYMEPGEDPLATAKRELLEETGYEAAEVELLGPLLPDTGRLGNRIWCSVARGLRRADDWQAEEGIEVVLASPAELKEAIADGRFDHALHVAAVLLAGVRGKFELP